VSRADGSLCVLIGAQSVVWLYTGSWKTTEALEMLAEQPIDRPAPNGDLAERPLGARFQRAVDSRAAT
jgi:hypothetical protein